MKYISASLAIAGALSASTTEAKPITLWPTERIDDSGLRRKLSGESGANQRFSSVSHAHFFTTAADVYDKIRENQEIEFGIPLFDGELERKACILQRGNPIVPDALANKFSQLSLFHCVTEDEGELNIVFDRTRIDGLSASFFDGKRRRNFYVDNVLKDSQHYVIYDSEVAAREGLPPKFEEGEIEYNFEELKFEFENNARLLQTSEFPAYKFKLAPLTNKQYSSFHGNTKDSVMAAIIECFTRVNGIYAREMGVFFTLIDDADLGICLDGDSRSACSDVSNGPSVIQSSLGILADLDIPASSYDIGHVLTTGSGGVAYLASLCNSRLKAGGTTGLAEPFTDVYFVDYVAHEIGHQLNGGHVFRDCAGRFDGNFMEMSAVEPGSGSSIMGYAGICGGNNVQTFSDPYFNNVNLQQMRDFVAQVGNNNCGEKVNVVNTVPEISVPASCKVPANSYFQLKGSSDEAEDSSFFSWDRSDTGYEDFDSSSAGKFRSWKPTTSKSRFFPNLYAINFPTSELANVELLPTTARDMSFRFTERRLYQTSAVAEGFANTIMGDFSYADLDVEFVSASKLTLTSPQNGDDIQAGASLNVAWTGVTGAGLTVEVLIAENILVETSDRFDNERDVKELAWEVLGSGDMIDGELSVNVPSSYGGKVVNVMLRSSFSEDVDSCFFFDLSVDVGVIGAAVVTENSVNDTLLGTSFILFGIGSLLASVFVYKNSKEKKPTSTMQQETNFTLNNVKEAPKGDVATRNPMADADLII